MLVAGLTGGIGAGKSTVARMLQDLGAEVVDADDLSREVVRPGTEALARIVEAFGADVVDSTGMLDRARLAGRVFTDADQRARLEAIVHPAIEAAFGARVQELARSGATTVVYEAALLVETGRHVRMDLLIVVVAEQRVRVRRLMERDGVDEIRVRERLAAQWPQERKAELADYIIDNSRDTESTRRHAVRVWREICERGSGTEP